MKEYIERDVLLEEVNDAISNIAFSSPYQDEIYLMIDGMERIRDRIEEVPAADVAPVIHGEWNPYPSDAYMKCSVCGMEYLKSKMPQVANYCPNCGADMKES